MTENNSVCSCFYNTWEKELSSVTCVRLSHSIKEPAAATKTFILALFLYFTARSKYRLLTS